MTGVQTCALPICQVSAVPTDTIAPAVPQNLTSSSGDGFVDLSWNPNSETDLFYYTVYRSITDGFTPVPSDSIGITIRPDTSYRDSGVVNEMTYYYRVSAVDSFYNSSQYSVQTSALPVDTIAPAVPRDLSVSAGQESINLSWYANTESDLLGYVIYRSLTDG